METKLGSRLASSIVTEPGRPLSEKSYKPLNNNQIEWTPDDHIKIYQRWLLFKDLVNASPVFSAASEQLNLADTGQGKDFTYLPCPLCSKDHYQVFHPKTIKGYTVVQCTACGFLYRNPSYRSKMIEKVYNQGYLQFLDGTYSQARKKLYGNVINQLGFAEQTAHFNRYRLLDVGCGHGLFLTVAREQGWKPYGLDFAADCIQHARTVFGLKNVYTGNLEYDSFEPDFFDAVTLWSVAAHLDDPLGMFRKISRVLRPGGLLIVYTVNANSLGHQVNLSNWRGFQTNHLVFFTIDSLEYALRKTGFKITKTAHDNRRLLGAVHSRALSPEYESYFRELFAQHNLGMLMVSAVNLPTKRSSTINAPPKPDSSKTSEWKLITWSPAGYNNIIQKWRRYNDQVAKNPVLSAACEQIKLHATPNRNELMFITCPLCKKDSFRFLYLKTRSGYPITRCTQCGFLYRNPTFTKNMIKKVYSLNYLDFLSGDYEKGREQKYRRVLNQLQFEMRTAGFQRRRILDVGCGHGLFLTVAREMGWEPYGVDFATDCIQHAKTAFGLKNVTAGNLEDDSFEPDFFDTVTLWSVVAHLDDPIGMFKKISRVLRPGGIVIIYTVDAGALMHLHQLSNWKGFDGNHLVFFTFNLLRQTLMQTGFTDVDVVYDNRFLNKAIRQGTVSTEHREFFNTLAVELNLGYMMKVVAVNR